MAGHKQIQLEHPIYSNCWWKFLENQCSSNRHQTRHWPLALKYLSCPFMEHFSSTNGLFPPKKQNKTKKTTTVVCSKPLLHIVHCKQMRNVFFWYPITLNVPISINKLFSLLKLLGYIYSFLSKTCIDSHCTM